MWFDGKFYASKPILQKSVNQSFTQSKLLSVIFCRNRLIHANFAVKHISDKWQNKNAGQRKVAWQISHI